MFSSATTMFSIICFMITIISVSIPEFLYDVYLFIIFSPLMEMLLDFYAFIISHPEVEDSTEQYPFLKLIFSLAFAGLLLLLTWSYGPSPLVVKKSLTEQLRDSFGRIESLESQLNETLRLKDSLLASENFEREFRRETEKDFTDLCETNTILQNKLNDLPSITQKCKDLEDLLRTMEDEIVDLSDQNLKYKSCASELRIAETHCDRTKARCIKLELDLAKAERKGAAYEKSGKLAAQSHLQKETSEPSLHSDHTKCNKNLEKKTRLVTDLRKTLRDNEEIFQQNANYVADLNDRIAELEKEQTDLEEQVAELYIAEDPVGPPHICDHSTCMPLDSSQDSLIDSLRRDNEETTRRAEQAEARSADQAATIQGLRSTLGTSEESAKARGDLVVERDQSLTDVQNCLAAKKADCDKLDVELRAKEANVTELEGSQAASSARCETLQAEIAEKDERIAEHQSRIAEHQSHVSDHSSLERRLDDSHRTNRDLWTSVAARDAAIVLLRKDLADSKLRSEGLELTAHERASEYADLGQRVTSASKDFSELKRLLGLSDELGFEDLWLQLSRWKSQVDVLAGKAEQSHVCDHGPCDRRRVELECTMAGLQNEVSDKTREFNVENAKVDQCNRDKQLCLNKYNQAINRLRNLEKTTAKELKAEQDGRAAAIAAARAEESKMAQFRLESNNPARRTMRDTLLRMNEDVKQQKAELEQLTKEKEEVLRAKGAAMEAAMEATAKLEKDNAMHKKMAKSFSAKAELAECSTPSQASKRAGDDEDEENQDNRPSKTTR